MHDPRRRLEEVDNQYIGSSLGFRYLTIIVADLSEDDGAAPAARRRAGEGALPPRRRNNYLILVKDPDGNTIELIGPQAVAARGRVQGSTMQPEPMNDFEQFEQLVQARHILHLHRQPRGALRAGDHSQDRRQAQARHVGLDRRGGRAGRLARRQARASRTPTPRRRG